MDYFELPKDVVAHLYDNNMIVDGVRGGLVVGDRHSEGGINLMMLCEGAVYAVGEMEGGEYLVNVFATHDYLGRLEQINNDRQEDDEITPEEAESVRHIIVPSGHWLLIGRGASIIINRSSTKKYLQELDTINESTQDIFDQPHK